MGRKKKGDDDTHEKGSFVELCQGWMKEEAKAFKVLLEGMSE